jgi:hypothetical protein
VCNHGNTFWISVNTPVRHFNGLMAVHNIRWLHVSSVVW